MVNTGVVVGAALLGGAALTAVILSKPVSGAVPTTLTFAATTPTSISAGGGVSFLVSAFDSAGKPLPNVSGQVILSGSSAVASFTTNSLGQASVTASFPTVGTYSLYAASGGLTSQQVVVTVNPAAAQLGSLALTAGVSSVIAGGSVSFSILAKDTSGNPIAATGSLVVGGTVQPGNWVSSGTTGLATMSLVFATAGSYSMTAVSGTVTSNAVGVTVTQPAPQLGSILLSAPAVTTSAGGTLTFNVTTLDTNGFAMPSVSGQMVANSVVVSGSTWTTGPGGTTSVALTFGTVGTYIVSATSGSVGSAPLTVTVTAVLTLTTLSLSSNLGNVPVNGSATFTSVARNQNGAAMGGISVQPKVGGANAGTVVVTDPTGTATFSLTFSTVGTFLVTATGTQSSTGVSVTSPAVTIQVTQPVSTSPVTLDVSSNVGATKADNQHKSFFAAGLYWVWYLKDSNIVYITSVDKVTWSAPTVVLNVGFVPGEAFDVAYDPQTQSIYFVFCLSTPSFRYFVASPTLSGTLSFITPMTTVPVPGATGPYGVNRPTIKADTIGNIYVALEESVLVGTSSIVHVIVYQRAASVWSQIFDYNTNQSSADWMGTLLKLTGGKMTLYYGTVNGGSTGLIQDWSGTAWGPQIVFPGTSRLEPENGGGITIGDTVYWAGFNYDSSGIIGFWKHAYGDTAVPAITQLANSTQNISDGQGCISSDGVTQLIAFFSSSTGYSLTPTSEPIYYRISTDLGTTWGPQQTFTPTPESGGIQGKTLQCTDVSSTGEILVNWTAGFSPSYTVRFASLIL